MRISSLFATGEPLFSFEFFPPKDDDGADRLFAAIAAFAQVLGIGWKNRVLQLATGLSFYSAIDLLASLLMVHGLHPHDLTQRVEEALAQFVSLIRDPDAGREAGTEDPEPGPGAGLGMILGSPRGG